MVKLVEPPSRRNTTRFIHSRHRRLIDYVRYMEDGASDAEVLRLLEKAATFLRESIEARGGIDAPIRDAEDD